MCCRRLEEDGKMAQIYVRASKKSGLVPYTAVKNIPLNVATICISSFYDHFNKKRRDYYIIEDSNLEPYRFIFEWVKQCGEKKGVANLPEVSLFLRFSYTKLTHRRSKTWQPQRQVSSHSSTS